MFPSDILGRQQDVELIARVDLLADAASILFSGIPQTFRHLRIIGQLRTTQAVTIDYLAWRFNGDAGNNYNYTATTIRGATLGAGAGGGENYTYSAIFAPDAPGASASPNRFVGFEAMLPEYAGNGNKVLFVHGHMVYTGSTPGARYVLGGGVWENNAAINSISVQPGNVGNLAAGSRLALYGIR